MTKMFQCFYIKVKVDGKTNSYKKISLGTF